MSKLKREKHPNWKGGRIKKNGYWIILNPKHHRSAGGYVPEHVLVAERLLGRKLKKEEIVIHLNRNSFDNSPYNLYVCKDSSERGLLGNKEFDLPFSNIL